ncbi:MAG TPA: ABC transporter ATP-binding protein [Verrucomicrobia bacterium]|nr:MAG: ABC transporter ATP-binding protein [Lentisphaerae bacterium GWF2_57_35]HBA85652.1 ABC transporter ATP-binding protein [Verrucomicrobiota bacterium]
MLRIEDLSIRFKAGTPDEVCVLDGIQLQVKEGSFVVVIGTNGSGKSTLLNAVAGVFPPERGRIEVAGQDVTRWPEHRRARLIGRVFQNPFSGTAPHMTVAENLALAARRGLARGLRWALLPGLMRQMKDRVGELNMGLEDRLESEMGSLSGGQRQALTLLMASWVRPQLLLLDEHTAALDPKAADQVIRLTHQIVTRDRLTTLMVTHSMAQAVHLGDRLIMMNKGQIIFDAEGMAKKSLRVEDLMARFEEVRRDEQLDVSAAKMLKALYI